MSSTEAMDTVVDTAIDTTREAVYLLGFSLTCQRALVAELLEHFPAIEVATFKGLDYWHLGVDRSEFEGEAGENHLTDAAWLTPRVLAHQAALEYFAARISFFPLSFGSLFSTLDALVATIELNEASIIDFLEQSHAQTEWGLKCFVSWEAAYDQAQGEDGELLPPPSGADYLRRKKAIRQRDEHLRQVAEQQLQAVVQAAYLHANRLVERRIVAQSSAQQCVSNWALLVSQEKSEALREWVTGINEATGETCIRVELTGPWPLYSFAPPLQASMQAEAAMA